MELVNIGPIDLRKRGGVITAANEAVIAFEKTGFKNTNLSTLGPSKTSILIKIYYNCLKIAASKSEVKYIFHLTFRNIFIFFPLISILVFFRKTTIVRKFAGDLDLRYVKSNMLQKYIISQTLKRVSKFYVETAFLKNKLENLLNKSRTNLGIWENTRDTTGISPCVRETLTNKLVFISRVSKDKGIERILSVLPHIKNPELSLDVYGPLEDISAAEIDVVANYKGILSSEEQVIEVLKTADALILPSTYASEGCPGILIEAMSVGTPVIVSNWRALPEVVENGGVVLNDFEYRSFCEAIISIRKDRKFFSEAAIQKSKDYDTFQVHKRIVREIHNIV
jgi:glycosyltransferase involved in cell wall biosynthesis